MYPYKDFYGGKAHIPTPGVLPYISHIGMYRPKGLGFLRRFGLKTGIDFAHLGLELGMVFEETTGHYKDITEPETAHKKSLGT